MGWCDRILDGSIANPASQFLTRAEDSGRGFPPATRGRAATQTTMQSFITSWIVATILNQRCDASLCKCQGARRKRRGAGKAAYDGLVNFPRLTKKDSHPSQISSEPSCHMDMQSRSSAQDSDGAPPDESVGKMLLVPITEEVDEEFDEKQDKGSGDLERAWGTAASRCACQTSAKKFLRLSRGIACITGITVLVISLFAVSFGSISVSTCTHPQAAFPGRHAPVMLHKSLFGLRRGWRLFGSVAQGVTWDGEHLFCVGTDTVARVSLLSQVDKLDAILGSSKPAIPDELSRQGMLLFFEQETSDVARCWHWTTRLWVFVAVPAMSHARLRLLTKRFQHRIPSLRRPHILQRNASPPHRGPYIYLHHVQQWCGIRAAGSLLQAGCDAHPHAGHAIRCAGAAAARSTDTPSDRCS